jgi:hypothetical protein
MGQETERQDGMIAKYIISKGLPESIQITSKRLAVFCAKHLSQDAVSNLSHMELKELGQKRYTDTLRRKARYDLRNAYVAGSVIAASKVYKVMRVEDWPEYHIALELTGVDANGNS